MSPKTMVHIQSNLALQQFQRLFAALAAASPWTKGLLTAALGALAIRAWHAARQPKPLSLENSDQPGLFKKHSSFESFIVPSGFTYPRIRVFYHAHPQEAKLPSTLPLLVFMHGLGGNATQFASLLTSLVNVAPCLAIDLPGCGLSDFAPKDERAYTTAAFAELLATAIDRYRNKDGNQQVVLVGHSMGCSISALLASSHSPLHQRLNMNYIAGFIAICPKASPPSEKEIINIDRLRWMPTPVFNLLRWYDRRGGLNSTSVARVVGHEADDETKKLQQKYNRQSKSAVFLRFVTAGLPAKGSQADDSNVIPWPGKEVWSGIKVPLFLLAGGADKLTPPEQVDEIARWLSEKPRQTEDGVAKPAEPDVSANPNTVPTTAGDIQLSQDHITNPSPRHGSGPQTVPKDMIKDDKKSTKHGFVLKTAKISAPAAHGFMYTTTYVRVVSGLIEEFLAKHVDERLSMGWQLQHLTTSRKWDVKNLKKWQSIAPCSAPIGGVFRAMKTTREVDPSHNPTDFVKQYSHTAIPDGVAMVLDISHESPVYNPKKLEEGGVEYHKFPTVSKLPPTADEVEHFINTVDNLRRSLPPTSLGTSPPSSTNSSVPPPSSEEDAKRPTIGVHCHYGFNRTGFFIVSYLIERLAYPLQTALDEFAAKRAPGIKHEHFVNELWVRYSVKVQRRRTLTGG
ncbi:hypothetical protein KC318_g9825 [Hortaea werneckii]|uniref:Tyrosine specific protein phosphatases domain-containing protein n=1 Tax=Hortaea werneckii TaxID=91943 RepID=A0A3M6XFF2_HORWE|nr:hypothetical protein KC334_g10377 [Hortaea werneckii]KAI7002340.1 hypothetical protein KC355_g9878 [Hortaea werneckii]KAI7660840.1 hypothetical protein KC318_g9825 [Hortaea werneckii]RMX89268.1 hypothetical protein D0867_15451 [Hortaea werneckii]RMY03283.1 hypothetical protein D0866_15518 [Hortaea werneckii]